MEFTRNKSLLVDTIAFFEINQCSYKYHGVNFKPAHFKFTEQKEKGSREEKRGEEIRREDFACISSFAQISQLA